MKCVIAIPGLVQLLRFSTVGSTTGTVIQVLRFSTVTADPYTAETGIIIHVLRVGMCAKDETVAPTANRLVCTVTMCVVSVEVQR